MKLCCSRRILIMMVGRHHCMDFILGIGVFFLLGYLLGTLLTEDPKSDISLLSERTHRRDVERASEVNEIRHKSKIQPKTTSPNYVSSLNKTWLTWDNIDRPAVYRACVKKPEERFMRLTLTGDRLLDDRSDRMTIESCIDVCIQLVFTYAALTRGSECYCTDVSAASTFLSYVDSAFCDQPCTGDASHNCGGEKYMSVYRTSVPDARCSYIKLGTPGSFPLLALASFPRSGNTWTRQLIEKATGIYTGSIYWTKEKEMEISKAVFKGGNIDYNEKRTICVKTHKHDIGHVRQFEGAVLLIRNPYRAMVAEVFRRKIFASDSTTEAALKYFKSKEWDKFVTDCLKDWKEMNLRWVENSKRCLAVSYEELERNTTGQLSRIVAFLNRTVDPERLVCAAQDHPSSLATGTALGNHGLKTRVYLTTDPFSLSMRRMIDETIRSINSTLYERQGQVLPREYLEPVDVF